MSGRTTFRPIQQNEVDPPALVNLTRHSITMVASNGTRVVYHPHGPEARVSIPRAHVDSWGDIPIYTARRSGGYITNLPDPSPGVLYVVSRMVMEHVAIAAPERRDVVCPSDFIRDEQRRVVGARSFDRAAE